MYNIYGENKLKVFHSYILYMTEYAIFFSTTSQLDYILSNLNINGEISISRVRRPYLDKTRFKKRVAGSHIVCFTITGEEKKSLPFNDEDMIEVANKKWGLSKRLETKKKRWVFDKEIEKWKQGEDHYVETINELMNALNIKQSPEFNTSMEIPAIEFFAGINALQKALVETPTDKHNQIIIGWAKMFLARCIKAEPIFVIDSCDGQCGACPLVCDECNNKKDKLYVNPDEPKCVCCGGTRDIVNDKCLTCLEDCDEEEIHENVSGNDIV
jgi:hypothetical protein